MNKQDFNNLLTARKLILQIIDLAQERSNNLFFKQKITVEDFEKLFEEIEIPLCRIADDMAIVINQKLLNPVTGYKEEIKLVSEKIQDTLENSENFQSLIAILSELVNYFHNIISSKDTYPETSKIIDGIESICNHY